MRLFNTERLVIRPLELTDLDSFYDMQSNPNVMRFIKKTMNREESIKELNRFINYYQEKEIYFKIWAVETKLEQQFIGICGVYKNDKSEFEIAYRLRELYWGKGYGKEIAKGLINYCFQILNLPELTGYVVLGNKGSIKILAEEMNFEKEFNCKEKGWDERVYKIKKEEWLNKQ